MTSYTLTIQFSMIAQFLSHTRICASISAGTLSHKLHFSIKIQGSKAPLSNKDWHIAQRDTRFCDFGKELELLSIPWGFQQQTDTMSIWTVIEPWMASLRWLRRYLYSFVGILRGSYFCTTDQECESLCTICQALYKTGAFGTRIL